MKNRDLLQIGSKIWLISTEDEHLEEFTITEVCGQGGSAICYRATKNGRNGILKEFYPIDSEFKKYAVNLSRKYCADSKLRGQLYSEDSTIPNLINLRDNYYLSCKKIIEAKTDEEELNNFIPRFEIFKSYTNNASYQNFTYYTWVLEDISLKPFSDILSDICTDIDDYGNRVKNTLLIIDCVLELTKSVCLLHLSGLLHLDLTPANFGVSTYMGTANKNITISLYDTNTIYAQEFDDYIASGTPGFRSPEVEKGQKDNYGIRSDIYSIGAILYYAFVIDSDNKNHIYSREKCGKKSFESIDNDLKNSVFLKLSDETINTFVYNDLLSIIKKALNVHNAPCGCFEKTEDLIKAIELLKSKFIVLVGQNELENYGRDWIDVKTKTKEEHYNEIVKTGATGAIQWLLYKYPLYDYKINNTDLNVLVLGCGTYSPKFIDTALELSQIEGLNLNLTVASEAPDTDKSFYLNDRPELCGFFSVDSNEECKRAIHPYGNIEFKKAYFDISTSNPDVEKLFQEKAYSYVFIALNDENLNEKVAQQCSAYIENKAIVSYIVYDKSGRLEQTNNDTTTVPVCVTDVLSEQADYKYLEQMALNAHLLWSAHDDSDLKEAEATFYNDNYNYNSSLKNALSIKYKLHSINLKGENPCESAVMFKQKYAEEKDSLIMYEQKRWNVGQITDGWKVMERSEYGTLKTATKDKDQKKHPIICDTDKENPLDKWEKSKWDTASLSEINDLDPLNQMSVYMHRHFAELSKNIRRKYYVIKGQFDLLSKIVHKNARLMNLLTFLSGTVDKMLNDNLKHSGLVKSYSHYKNAFETELKAYCDDVDFKKADECLKSIDKDLFPLIQSLSYKNWKNNNSDLIENIPFILTYSKNIHICMPMILGDENHNCELFFNVASAIKIRPSKVTYIIDGDFIVNNGNSLFCTLNFIYRIFKTHKVQTKIDLVILKNRYISNNFLNRDEIKKRFDRINKIDYIDYDDSNKQAVLTSYLRDNQSIENTENKFTALEYPCSDASDLYTFVKNANQGLSDDVSIVPAFYFDEKSQNFIAYGSDCEWLNYIPFKQNLHVNELFNDDNVAFSEPELGYCIDFINDIFINEYDIWCKLCDIISSQIEYNQKLTQFHTDDLHDTYKSTCEFVFPSFCEKAVYKIINNLKYYNIVSNEFDIVRLNSKVSLLRIENLSESYKTAFESLFENYIQLSDEALIFVEKVDNDIIVRSDGNLDISDMCMDERFNMSEKKLCVSLLNRLNKEHIIFSLKIENTDGNTSVSFKFPSIYEKQLMSNSNKIVQDVLYYELLKSELFDDIQSDVMLSLGDNMSIKADAIATKGFRTFIFITQPISCDAFSAVREKFLINGALIMVNHNGDEKNDCTTEGVCILSLNDKFQSKLYHLIN